MNKQSPPFVSEKVLAECEACIGRTREITDSLSPEPAEKFCILMDRKPPGEELPPTFHWAYFSKGIPLADLGPDLHERTGLFLPAAPFHRRMWAAGEVSVSQPLRIGTPATRRSTIADVAFKEGNSGAMCFVTISHEIEQNGVPCIAEKQIIVYRDRGEPETALRQPDEPVPDGYFTHPESQLFFYSALTHNGHRIHWDRAFCRETEGYADLVVHGPLMATELCEAMRGSRLSIRFRYRALAPVFTTTPVRILPGTPGTERKGTIERSDGTVSMSATLTSL